MSLRLNNIKLTANAATDATARQRFAQEQAEQQQRAQPNAQCASVPDEAVIRKKHTFYAEVH
jgi:hypothetical protein